MTLRERAVQAYAPKLAAQNERIKKAVKVVFDLDVEPKGGYVDIDEFRFTISHYGELQAHLLCYQCGKPVTDRSIDDLADLGQLVHEASQMEGPGLCYDCGK